MDFAFTDEQQMLLDTTRRFIAERYSFEQRNRVRASDSGWSREVWSQMGELGLLSINIPEEDGGLQAGPFANMLVANAIGEGLMLEPFLQSAVIATRTVVGLGSPAQRESWLPAMASGTLIAIVAHDEPSTRLKPLNVETRAAATDHGWEISGCKTMVYHGPAAGLLLVSACVENELGLFSVSPDAQGVSMQPYKTVDEQCAADIVLDRVRIDTGARLGGEAGGVLRDALDYGLASLCGEAFGAMERLLASTIAYSRSRVQFGAPIGSFQVLQHRMAQMWVHLEQARSMCYLAASQFTHQDARVREQALSAVKTLMGQAARYIGQQAVQLHGGMGMTDELDVSHYFKRLLAFELRHGTTDQHLARYRIQGDYLAPHDQPAHSAASAGTTSRVSDPAAGCSNRMHLHCT